MRVWSKNSMQIASLTLLVAALAAGPAMAQGAGAPSPGGRGMANLAEMDANHDGAITHAEAEGARTSAFARMDNDHDGFVTASELGERRAGMIQRADTDHDGKVSRAELMAQPYRAFDRLDANHDNTISAEERAAGRASSSN